MPRDGVVDVNLLYTNEEDNMVPALESSRWLLRASGRWLQSQTTSRQSADLDVTMQIIVDPNAKLPDEVVRRIPLPASRSAAADAAAENANKAKPDAADKGVERAQEARELGREAAESARERAREAAQQREEARNSDAKERGKDTERPEPQRPPRP
jgi:hypothetical protein